MKTSELNYILPDELIAQEPIEPRDHSRMLVLERTTGNISHRHFYNISEYLNAGDLLVINNTRVTARRLMGKKETGVVVEALIVKHISEGVYEAIVKPGRRLKPGQKVYFDGGLVASVLKSVEYGGRLLEFEGTSSAICSAINQYGAVPLPPYIHRSCANPERYQTVFSRVGGSAAAPTAGLHFTPELLTQLIAKDIKIANITLDISLDTFRPIRTDNTEEHSMHGEHYSIGEETADLIAQCRGRIIAVGTTCVRSLESAAKGKRLVKAGSEMTKLFITPGYEFKVCDAMVTNFHLPQTTMLALVGAMAGMDNLMKAYQEAVQLKYRFLSFGDAMLVI